MMSAMVTGSGGKHDIMRRFFWITRNLLGQGFLGSCFGVARLCRPETRRRCLGHPGLGRLRFRRAAKILRGSAWLHFRILRRGLRRLLHRSASPHSGILYPATQCARPCRALRFPACPAISVAPLGYVIVLTFLVGVPQPSDAGETPSFDPLIGARYDKSAALRDSTGTARQLGEMLDPRGTLLVLGYHRCENLCGVLQQALAETLSALPDKKSPTILFASLDPSEGPPDARAMQEQLAASTPGADLSHWRFLTGDAPALSALAEPMRMETYVRPGGDVIVHPAAMAVLTMDGRLSEVFYGFDFTAAELEAALDRAADGHIGGLREQIMLFCSGIDAAVGKLARDAWGAVRIASAAFLGLLGIAVLVVWRRERG